MKTEGFKMKTFKLGLRVAAIAGLSALLSVSAMAGIENSKHDLRGASTSTGTTFTGATEICAFCHTPHAASDKTTAPLWNRAVGVASSFTKYTSSTLDGTIALEGSPSLACLSCHDGTQAMNTVINGPSVIGNYNYSAGGSFAMGTNSVSAMMTGSIVPNHDVDLTNDHPVAIPYAGGGLTGTSSVADLTDQDFNQPVFDASLDAWWVELKDNVTAGRQKSDIILYTRTVDSTKTGYVECASCHDPHAGDNVSFLRPATGNANSQVCLACHNK